MIDIAEVWGAAFGPPDRRGIDEWAAQHVTLPPVLARSGRVSFAASRHLLGPLAALRHDKVRGVRILKPVRGAGTLVADIAIPWAIVNDNASVLFILQDSAIAEAHAETRTMPTLKSVSAIRPMLSIDRHQTRKANILFANGLPFSIQGPALGGLQSRGFKWVICDEPWLYAAGVLGEAKARLGDFVVTQSSKFLAISQGGEDDSDWDFETRAGVLFVWHVPCAGCHEMMAPEWGIQVADGSRAGAVYESVKLGDGSYDKDATAASVRFVCPRCGHAHPYSQRTLAAWNDCGAYIRPDTGEVFDPANPPTECTFRWHSLIFYPWPELVKLWLSAMEAKRVGNFVPMVQFFQKRCALHRSERTIHDSELPFTRIAISQAEPAAKSWDGEVVRFLTADRQSEDTYWVMIRAWGGGGESRRLWYGKVFSEVDIEAKRAEYGVQPECVAIDSGYRPKGDHGVYSACIRYGWFALKGVDQAAFWHSEIQDDGTRQRTERPWAPITYGDPGEGSKTEGVSSCALYRFSAPTTADRVVELIGRGLWAEPNADENSEEEIEYKRQMSAEFKRPRVDKFTGRKVMVWVCPSGNNHAFDCAKMQVLCAMQAGILPAEFQEPTTNDNDKKNDYADK